MKQPLIKSTFLKSILSFFVLLFLHNVSCQEQIFFEDFDDESCNDRSGTDLYGNFWSLSCGMNSIIVSPPCTGGTTFCGVDSDFQNLEFKDGSGDWSTTLNDVRIISQIDIVVNTSKIAPTDFADCFTGRFRVNSGTWLGLNMGIPLCVGGSLNGSLDLSGSPSNISLEIEVSTNNPGNIHVIDDISVDIVLPVELSDFQVERIGQSALVFWETTSEVQNDYFMIERSLDGSSFFEIGRIKGAGNSSQAISYNYIDSNPAFGPNYYRLKQYDFDNRYRSSEIKVLTFENFQEERVYNAYPTLVNESLQIEFIRNRINYSQALIINALGQIVMQVDLKNSNEYLSIDLGHLEKGHYYTKIGAQTSKFIKL